ASVLLPAALLLAALGFAVLTQLREAPGVTPVVVGMVLFSLGLSPVFTLSTDLVVSSAPPERAGAAAALSETSSELGAALGVGVLGSIGGLVYRTLLAPHLPSTLSSTAALAARSTLGGALNVAATLPGAERASLIRASRVAFTSGLEVTAGIAAGIALVLALGSALMLRKRAVTSHGE